MKKQQIIEVLKKHCKSHYHPQDGGIPDFHYINSRDIESIADELQAKELSDEEIEKAFPTSDINCGDIGKELHASINIAKQEGAKWYRDR